MLKLEFSIDQLKELEALEIRGGQKDNPEITEQDKCINAAAGCGVGIKQSGCTNSAAGCGTMTQGSQCLHIGQYCIGPNDSCQITPPQS